MTAKLLYTEVEWRSTQLSIAQYYRGININGTEYVITDKGDLIDIRIQKAYKRIGRDRIIKLINSGATLNEISSMRLSKPECETLF